MIVLMAVGMLLGADEVAVIAAARALHSTTTTAPLFAIWGAGSLIGGLLLTRLGGGARTAGGLALLLGALTAGHLALIPADGSVLELGAVLLLAGAAIAPTEATLYAMVDNAAPAGTGTEAFAWLATGMAIGDAIGAAGAGLVADHAGPTAAFALAGGAGALAVLTTLKRTRTLVPPRHAPKAAGDDPDRQRDHRAGAHRLASGGAPRSSGAPDRPKTSTCDDCVRELAILFERHRQLAAASNRQSASNLASTHVAQRP
ncbi:MAG: MFS transporter [Actinomycetota bacterium]|nr:MFS transporter [Actinomycetota bacterium]